MMPPPERPSQGPFLARCVRWEWHDNTRIDILDEHDHPMCTLDEWQTLVFHEADGQQTLERIISAFPTNYRDPARVPSAYRHELSAAARFLIEDRQWVALWDRRNPLPRDLALPLSEQADAPDASG
jgi:hypothetical protein